MARLDCFVHNLHSHAGKAWPIIFILIICACQPFDSPSPAPMLVPTGTKAPPHELLPTALPATPSLALLGSLPATIRPAATRNPTVTKESAATAPATTISSDAPWLVYRQQAYYSPLEQYDELVVLNQAGSGSILIRVPGCDFYDPLLIEEDSSNRVVILGKLIYLIQPSRARGKLVYRPWPTCHTAFTGNADRGFLASIYHPAPNAIPELQFYEMPSGKIRDEFPLVKCSDQIQGCDFSEVDWWEIQWSPNGRYLAFPAILDGPSSDLYVYDIENGKIRRLTSGPDQVGQIWWSPDGKWIIIGEIQYEYPYTSSLWAISLPGNEIRLLYSLEHPFPQGNAGWLDNERLLTSLARFLSLAQWPLASFG